jgi:hypothetical protein
LREARTAEAAVDDAGTVVAGVHDRVDDRVGRERAVGVAGPERHDADVVVNANHAHVVGRGPDRAGDVCPVAVEIEWSPVILDEVPPVRVVDEII